jgi:hypothetical protein
MKPFRWNPIKNEMLKVERDISFEVISLAIEADGLLDVLRHPNTEKYSNQSVFVVAFDRLCWQNLKLLLQLLFSRKNGSTFACPRRT